MEIINVTLNSSLSYVQKQDQQQVERVKNEESEDNSTKTAFEKVKEAVEEIKFESEEEKKVYEQKLNQKIKKGEKLTQDEMNYIRRTNPTMYLHIKRVQMQREMLENKLKHCKSKKEVADAYNQTMGLISDDDPDREALVSAYTNVTDEFKKTNEYKALPRVEKEEEKGTKTKEKNIEELENTPADYDVIDKFDISV